MTLMEVAVGGQLPRVVKDHQARHPCQGPSNGVLFELPVEGQVGGRARRNRNQEACRCQAADFSPKSVQKPRPGPLGPAPLCACMSHVGHSVTPQMLTEC